jgi:hypothetical protein
MCTDVSLQLRMAAGDAGEDRQMRTGGFTSDGNSRALNPSSCEFARRWRMAPLMSWICAGNFATGERR